MAIHDMPDDRFAGGDLHLAPVQQINRSAYTNNRQIIAAPWFDRWLLRGAAHVPVIGEANIVPWRAFFDSLNGQAEYFRYPATETDQHSGSVTAAVVSSSGSTNLVIGGLPNSTTFLPAGARLTVELDDGNEQLIALTAALVTNGSGEATALFRPPLRGPVSAANFVETKRPWAQLALSNPEAAIPVSPGQVYNFTIDAEEDW